MDNDCIDLSLENIWQSWLNYRKGKKSSLKLLQFQYNLESEIFQLFTDLNSGNYKHGGYRKFIVCDNKRRIISVAPIRDRVVHRLIYDYLVRIYDKTFIYDAWSCRMEKGLIGAIERTQYFLKSFPNAFIWQADIKKFFDNVDHEVILKILNQRIKDPSAYCLIEKIITSFSNAPKKKVGMPIGNLTSQIFANIYLNELDRFIKHHMKPLRYLRYGDDFIVLDGNLKKLKSIQSRTISFLNQKLKLQINPGKNAIHKTGHGLKFLGVIIYSKGRKLNRRNELRIRQKLNSKNASSYYGLVNQHSNQEKIKEFNWFLLKKV